MKEFWKKLLRPKWYEIILLVLVFSYIALVSSPNFLFKTSHTFGVFNVYSDRGIPTDQLNHVLSKAQKLIERSEIFNKDHTHDVYLVSSNIKYRILAFTSGDGFGASYPLINNIFINQFDVKNDLVRTKKDINNKRSLSSVIAHEAIHSLVEKYLGFLKFKFSLKKWKDEGYADYISNESSFPEDQGMNFLCSGKEDKSSSFRYFKYKKAVSYLKSKGLKDIALFNEQHDLNESLRGFIGSNCSSN